MESADTGTLSEYEKKGAIHASYEIYTYNTVMDGVYLPVLDIHKSYNGIIKSLNPVSFVPSIEK